MVIIDEEVAWLVRMGLGALCSIAKEKGFNGGILQAFTLKSREWFLQR